MLFVKVTTVYPNSHTINNFTASNNIPLTRLFKRMIIVKNMQLFILKGIAIKSILYSTPSIITGSNRASKDITLSSVSMNKRLNRDIIMCNISITSRGIIMSSSITTNRDSIASITNNFINTIVTETKRMIIISINRFRSCSLPKGGTRITRNTTLVTVVKLVIKTWIVRVMLLLITSLMRSILVIKRLRIISHRIIVDATKRIASRRRKLRVSR